MAVNVCVYACDVSEGAAEAKMCCERCKSNAVEVCRSMLKFRAVSKPMQTFNWMCWSMRQVLPRAGANAGTFELVAVFESGKTLKNHTRNATKSRRAKVFER